MFLGVGKRNGIWLTCMILIVDMMSWYWSCMCLGTATMLNCTPSFYFLTVFPFRPGTLCPKLSFINLTSPGVMGLFFNWFFPTISSGYLSLRWQVTCCRALVRSSLWASYLENIFLFSITVSTSSIIAPCWKLSTTKLTLHSDRWNSFDVSV